MQGFKSTVKSPRKVSSRFRRYIHTPAGSEDEMSDAGSEFSTITQRLDSQSNISDDAKSTYSLGSQQSLNHSSLSVPSTGKVSPRPDTSATSRIPFRNKKTMIPKPPIRK